MASPRALLLLLLPPLLVLPPPAAPGTHAPPPPAAHQPGRTPAVQRNYWPESHTSAHTANLTLGQDRENVTAVTSKERMLVQTPRKSLASVDAPKASTLQTETADAGGRTGSWRSLRGPHSQRGPERATVLTAQSSTWASAGTEGQEGLLTPRSPSTRQADSVRVLHTIPSSVRPAFHSLTVSLGLPRETESFPEASDLATMTYTSAPSSPSEAEPGGNDDALQGAGEGRFPKSGFALTSFRALVGFQPNDSAATSRHPLAYNSSAETQRLPAETATTSRSVPLAPEGESTAQWFWAHETFEDVAGNLTSSPGAVNASDVTRGPEPGASGPALRESHSSKPSTGSLSSSSSESLESSVLRGERSTTEYSPELGFSPDIEEEGTFEGTPRAQARDPRTAAAFTGSGERTLRSLTNRSAATSQNPGRSAATAQHTESATLRGNVTARLGVTGFSQDALSDSDSEPPTDDHTYISSAFTKGERALLSITENSPASRTRASATSSVQESGSGVRSHHPQSSGAQTAASKTTRPDGAHVRPSTAPLVPRTARPPSSTPTVNMPRTLVVLDAEAASAGGPSSLPSSSGPSLPLPSGSRPHQSFLTTLPSTRTSAPPLRPTTGAPTALPSSAPSSPVAPSTRSPTPPAIFHTTSVPPRTSVRMSTVASSVAALPGHQTTDPEKPSQAGQEEVTTGAPSPGSLPTKATGPGALNSTPSIPHIPDPGPLTEAPKEPVLPAASTRVAQTPPVVMATTLQASLPLSPTASPTAGTAAPAASHTTLQTEAEKLLPTSPGMFVPPLTTEGPITTQRSPVHTEATPGPTSPTSAPVPTKVTTPEPGIIREHSTASWFLTSSPASHTSEISTRIPKSQHTTPSPRAWSPASANSCATNPCLHGGRCIEEPPGFGYRCVCSPSWQGDDCSVDVNECLSNPCPPLAMCNNTQGSFICKCPVGYQLEKGGCSLVRTFVAELKVKKTLPNTTVELLEVENEITRMLNACLSPIPGYTQSTAHASREPSAMAVSLQATFSLAANVTLFDLADVMQRCANSCRASAELCHLLASQRRVFRVGSLCRRKSPECDRETSLCTDLDGIARCQCKLGYFQFNKMDHSCRACEDGYRLENETCLSCPFGLGGLNCGNPYQLITVVIAAAGGGLLLILGIALIVTCCRKNKNDISKLIFKSGDFQMSPYAEYPKNNPRSQEWGREAIEMHENGSTKNLLQMTDVYYSPTSVRNPELERNGLYPAYTGLPGSRHSCIFPGQYNPSFICDDSRRRDYF